MKKIVFILIFLTTTSSYNYLDKEYDNYYNEIIEANLDDVFYSDLEEYESLIYDLNQFKGFLWELGYLESRNRYQIYKGQYWGKYQIGRMARKDLGLHRINRQTFINNPKLQDESVLQYMRVNMRYLDSYIEKYSGSMINDILINEASILGGAHLVGQNGVKLFLESNGRIDRADGNGTKVSYYMEKFQSYDLNFNIDNNSIIKHKHNEFRNSP